VAGAESACAGWLVQFLHLVAEHKPRRPAGGLGHGPVPQIRGRPRDAPVRDRPGRGHRARRVQLRRQAAPPELRPFHAHVGGLDTFAQALLAAADLVERGELAAAKDARYAGWDGELGKAIHGGGASLADLEAKVAAGEISPVRRSGGQERLENIVNRSVWSAWRAG
jgi:hypothetical protein